MYLPRAPMESPELIAASSAFVTSSSGRPMMRATSAASAAFFTTRPWRASSSVSMAPSAFRGASGKWPGGPLVSSRRQAGPHLLTHRPPQDLAGAALGQLVPDLEGAGTLVAGQVLAGVGEEILLAHGGPHRDDGVDLLPPLVVGDADHGGLLDGGVLDQDVLHGPGGE